MLTKEQSYESDPSFGNPFLFLNLDLIESRVANCTFFLLQRYSVSLRQVIAGGIFVLVFAQQQQAEEGGEEREEKQEKGAVRTQKS